MPLKINGSSSGYTEIKAADAAANNTLTLPSASGTLMTTGGSNTFTSNQIIEVTDNSNAALRITQLGTGAAIRVEDSSNPDSSPFVVDAVGNVGIGAASPAYKLSFGAPANGTKSIALYETGAGNAFYGIGNDSDRMTFYTGNTSGGAERMCINNNGNVGIGTSSPLTGTTLTLPTRGAKALQITGSGAPDWYMQIDNAQASNFGSINFIVNGTSVGNVSHNTTNTSYNTSSDYRLKDNVQPMKGALEKVALLKPVTWTWKSNDNPGQGFIAHELQQVFPDAVTGEKDGVDDEGKPIMQGVDTSYLVATLVKAVQELSAKVDAQAAEIAALKGGA